MPRLTIAGLLLVTFAVAVGFSVSVVPASNNGNGFLAIYIADRRWLQGLQATGGILLSFELLRQALVLLRERLTALPKARLAIWTAVVVRAVLAAIVSAMLIVLMLTNREILSEPNHSDFLQVWTTLWPDLLLVASLLAAIRLMLVKHTDSEQHISGKSSLPQLAIQAFVLLGIAIIAAYIFIDRLTLTLLVHIAMDGIEKSQSLWKHRPETYPNHMAEGYWSFWCSVGALSAVVLASSTLFMDSRTTQPRRRAMGRIAFSILILCIGSYAYWFTKSEFPRLSPDFASVGSARLLTDTLAGALLWLGIGVWLGIALARRRGSQIALNAKPPTNSSLAALSAILILVAQTWGVVESIRSSISLPIIELIGLLDYMEILAQFMLMPETLLSLLLMCSALTLLWQAYRGRNEPQPLTPIRGGDLVWYTLASFALLAVAVPTFAAFGFCFWLGPFV